MRVIQCVGQVQVRILAGSAVAEDTTIQRVANLWQHFLANLVDNLFPAFYLVALVWLIRRKYVLEAGIVFFVLAMSVVGGNFWGIARYTLFIFPAFVLLKFLSRHRYGYSLSIPLIAIQFCFLFQFVFTVPPAP